MAGESSGNGILAGIKFLNDCNYQEAYDVLKPLAEAGDPEAQYYFGSLFVEEDFGIDYEEAARWYRMAASNGLGKANYSLGMLHMQGLLKQSSIGAAEKFLEQAILGGEYEGCFELGKYYGNSRNPEKSFKFFSAGAKKGHPKSINGLGICHQNGIGTPKDFELAKGLFEQSCWLGYGMGCINLARILKKFDTAPDATALVESLLPAITFLPQLNVGLLGGERHEDSYYASFQEFIEPLAKQGNALALNYLGERELRSVVFSISRQFPQAWRPRTLSSPKQFDLRFHLCRDLVYIHEVIGTYFQNIGDLTDVDLSHLAEIEQHTLKSFWKEITEYLDDAREYFEQSSNQGCEFAKFNLGMMCLNGAMGPKDESAATNYLRQAASKGHIGAMAELAFLGDDFIKDRLATLEEAAEYEHPRALYELGTSYLATPESEERIKKGAGNFKALAEHGKPDAMYVLAQLYLAGAGVENSSSQAKLLLIESAKLGHQKASELLEKLI